MKTFFISLNAKGIGAIGRHPHDTSDEKGLTPCVIGNSRGTLTDEACEKAIIEKNEKEARLGRPAHQVRRDVLEKAQIKGAPKGP